MKLEWIQSALGRKKGQVEEIALTDKAGAPATIQLSRHPDAETYLATEVVKNWIRAELVRPAGGETVPPDLTAAVAAAGKAAAARKTALAKKTADSSPVPRGKKL